MTEELRILIRQIQGRFKWGSGTPEGNVDGPMGCIYERTDTGDVYRKTTALGTLTGWVTM